MNQPEPLPAAVLVAPVPQPAPAVQVRTSRKTCDNLPLYEGVLTIDEVKVWLLRCGI